jgi:hypothetical protein
MLVGLETRKFRNSFPGAHIRYFTSQKPQIAKAIKHKRFLNFVTFGLFCATVY